MSSHLALNEIQIQCSCSNLALNEIQIQFVASKHHVMIGCDKLNIHLQRVQASFAHAEILGLNLTNLAYADMASEH